jgi:hypothetical protein
LSQPAHEADYFPLPRQLKQKVKDGLVAVAVANAVFLRAIAHNIYQARRYFDNFPLTSARLLALGTNILLLSLVIWAGIGLWRRSRAKALSFALEMLFLLLFLIPADYFRAEVLGYADSQFVAFLHHPAVLLVLFVLTALVLWRHRLVARTAAMAMVVTFPFALFTLARIGLMSAGLVESHACPAFVPPPPILPAQPNRPRVVWIIFDETDYRLAFANRPATVKLPEFDRLRQQSLSADQAFAPGDMTIISMPALITGRRVSAAAHDGCDLALTLDGTQTTNDFSRMPTVFSRARDLGFNTALVGWFIPYGRLVGASLNYCAWYGMKVLQDPDTVNFGGAMREQLNSVIGPLYNRQVYVSICQRSLRDALPVVSDPKFGLTLLHLPPPHFPGVWLPDKKEFTCLGIRRPNSYLNNLALADFDLGALRAAMEAAGQWDKTWVIVSADHSWRASKAYDGKRDFRIPYLVKPPGAGQPLTLSKPFNTLLTHDFILAILAGQVADETGAAEWINTHGRPDAPVKSNMSFSFE